MCCTRYPNRLQTERAPVKFTEPAQPRMWSARWRDWTQAAGCCFLTPSAIPGGRRREPNRGEEGSSSAKTFFSFP
ncbi:hypothetical protein BaRGS_00024102, partial [Batillaria attramentaria]